MTENNGAALKLFWGDKGLSIRGAAVIVFVMWLALIGSNLYAGYRLEQAFITTAGRTAADHHRLSTANEQTACVVTMSPADREKFRQEYRPRAWSRWCPWMQE